MNVPIAEIITIGDEILYGQILDTNSQWICTQLVDVGVKVAYRSTLGDNRKDIIESFERAKNRSDLVIITGGLGPTPDDLTKPCLAEFFGVEMEYNEEMVEHVRQMFAKWGKGLSNLNRDQGLLPSNAQALPNNHGTAPGMWFEENNTVYVSLPGVPMEMKNLMKQEVLPRLRLRWKLPVIYHRTLKTAGIGESVLHERIKDWEDQLPPEINLAYLPTYSQVKLRLTVITDDLNQAKRLTEKEIDKIMPFISKYFFGYDNETIESAVGKILKSMNMTMASAESCTGGHVAHLLTSVAGSSDYYKGSIVAYANEVKVEQLNVNNNLLNLNGAVSREVVEEMARNVCMALGTDAGIATSGIAGPGGGTEEKPIGTVWIASCVDGEVKSKLLNLGPRDRDTNIKISSLAVLNLLRLHLKDVREKDVKL